MHPLVELALIGNTVKLAALNSSEVGMILSTGFRVTDHVLAALSKAVSASVLWAKQ